MLESNQIILPAVDPFADTPWLREAGWIRFSKPREVIEAWTLEAVAPALARLGEATTAGLHAAGFVTYEAAPALDRAFVTHPPLAGLPLLWFGIYGPPESLPILPPATEPLPHDSPLAWTPALKETNYNACIARIRHYIAAGDTYQVNFTFPLHARLEGDPWRLFLELHQAQPTAQSAFILTERHAIACASPELFFAQRGEDVVTRPMKGTALRGRWEEEDRQRAVALRASAKDQAENVMIVDLMRNDLGRLARLGSIEVPRLFDVEPYPTVWQMTSTIRAKTESDPVQTLATLFPCGSITGAPKVRTMQIIRELEAGPRGVYCGVIGWLAPGRRAAFSVAIRTVMVERATGAARYGVGSGVTWSSTAADEYAECLAKAQPLRGPDPAEFELLETILWEPAGGFFLLARHLARLGASARFFGRPADLESMRRLLEETAVHFDAPRRVRLRLDADGRGWLENTPAPPVAERPWRIGLACAPLRGEDPFLCHKTTHRAVYEQACRERPELDDVLLWNERGELTESTRANLVLEEADGSCWTPPRECGLLAGTFREELLAQGRLRPRMIHTSELARGDVRLWLINSLRRWIATTRADAEKPCSPSLP